jgi:hypothetical protein
VKRKRMIIVDFETCCTLDCNNDPRRYANDPSVSVICIVIKEGNKPVKILRIAE